ncbi:MAG: hypothetical protein Q9M45_04670 [Robiginitomaculum sp.]|nr:hypothetical protein [Robiginitomaculum sp.]
MITLVADDPSNDFPADVDCNKVFRSDIREPRFCVHGEVETQLAALHDCAEKTP